MANLEVASRSLLFEKEFKAIDSDLHGMLVKNEMVKPHLWKTFFQARRAPPHCTRNAGSWHGTWGEDRRWWANGHRQYLIYMYLPEKWPERLRTGLGQWTATP